MKKITIATTLLALAISVRGAFRIFSAHARVCSGRNGLCDEHD
jgi:hypothetical protein